MDTQTHTKTIYIKSTFVFAYAPSSSVVQALGDVKIWLNTAYTVRDTVTDPSYVSVHILTFFEFLYPLSPNVLIFGKDV